MQPTRRAFLHQGSLLLAAGGVAGAKAFAFDEKPVVRAALMTDLHYADKASSGTRYYRETRAKLADAAKKFAEEKLDFLVELGDLVDAADTVEKEKGWLKEINKDFSAIAKERHYVFGNHCVQTLTKEEFLEIVGQERMHHAFDSGGVRFIVLDACFRGDGKPYSRHNKFDWTDANLPREQLDWLADELKKTLGKVVVFAHQRLDIAKKHEVKNAAAARKILADSKKVLAVFQGHSHENDHQEIDGIHYCTLRSMIDGSGEENSGYSKLEIAANGAIRVTGFRKQKHYDWKA